MGEDSTTAEREETSSAGSLDIRGRRFGDFEILARLGSGGMGEVYLARQISLSREVALKLLSPALASKAAALDRFLQESKIAASIDHPSVVTVIASGVTDGRPWMAMRLVRGVSLERLIETRGALGVEESFSAASRVARALQAAHDAGILHRDVKPGNVLVEGDPGDLSRARVYLADFGLACAGDGTTLTHSGEILGTPAYMSPEQASGGTLDARSDIYSLGATLYAMLSGRPPFEAESYFAVLEQVRTRDPVPLRKLKPSVDRDAALVCEKAMRWDRKERYASAAEFAEDLEARLARRPIRARPASVRYRTKLWIRRNPLTATAAAIAFLAAIVSFSAERAWRRSAALERADQLLAHGAAREAFETVENAPSFPWPLVDTRRLSRLAECAAATGDLARAVRSAYSLPDAQRQESLRKLREILSRQIRAARQLAENGGWWAALKVLREVLEGLEAFPERALAKDAEPWFDRMSLECAETASLALLEARETEQGLALWGGLVAERETGRAPEARARLEAVRGALSAALRLEAPQSPASTKDAADRFSEALGTLVTDSAPGDYLEASTLSAFDRGLSRKAARILLEHGIRVRAAEAFPAPETLEAGEVEARDDAGLERRREALRMLYLLDAYRHVFSPTNGEAEAIEEIEDWREILEKLRPAAPPASVRGDLRAQGDLDGDGRPEILFWSERDFSLFTWTEDGLREDEKFESAFRGQGSGEVPVLIADIFPGGPSEVLAVGKLPGEKGWFLRIYGWRPEAGFVPLSAEHPTSSWARGLSPNKLAAGDFDRDGEIEIAFGLEGASDSERQVQIIGDLNRPDPEPVYLPAIVKTADGEASVAGDTKAVLAGDFDGDGEVEIGAVVGPWKAYDVRFWKYDPSTRAYRGPLRIGPLGQVQAALALDVDGASPLEIFIACCPFYRNRRVFPEPPHTGIPYGLYLLRLPGTLTPESAARWSAGPKRPWAWEEVFQRKYSDYPENLIGYSALSATTLAGNRLVVAAATYEKQPGRTQATIDLLFATGKDSLRRHRLFSSRAPWALSATLLERRAEDGRKLGLLACRNPGEGAASLGIARVWEFSVGAGSANELPFAAVEGYARLERFEEAAAAARAALAEAAARGPEIELRALSFLAAAQARALAWEGTLETLTALRGALESQRPWSFSKERREAARWTEIAEVSLRLSRSERRWRVPGEISVRLEPLLSKDWSGPEIIFEHPERISIETPARLQLQGEISIERLGWDRRSFVGLVPSNTAREDVGYGILFSAAGGTEDPLRRTDLVWGRAIPTTQRVEEGATYRFHVELTGEDRLTLRLEDLGGGRPGRVQYVTYPLIDRERPLAADSGMTAPLSLPKDTYRFVVAGRFFPVPYDLPRATYVVFRNLELRIDP